MDNPATQRPRIVIIGAGMAGLTAANKLYTSTTSDHLFELHVVDGGSRIGGRINTSEFCGDPVELGATWIHGTEGSPVYRIAEESGLLHSHRPWESMDGDPLEPQTLAEGGHELDSSIVGPISALFNNLMGSIRGKAIDEDAAWISKHCDRVHGSLGVGSFLRKGLESYWGQMEEEDVRIVGKWSRKSLEEAIFAMHESTHMTFTSADDLQNLDYDGESKYEVFPGEEISIAGGYSGVIESLASVLPSGTIQLGKKVVKIQWNLKNIRPVKLHFGDGSALCADHLIVTVSLGVLKHGCDHMFEPRLPGSKSDAIAKLGFGLVDKVFLQLPSGLGFEFPFVQMVFHPPTSEERNASIPRWMRRASWCYPIYSDSGVVVSWFTGEDAHQIEGMTEEDIAAGFSETFTDLLSAKLRRRTGKQLKFTKALRSRWGSDPLFLGSYTYVAVGSSGDDIDALSEPLPENSNDDSAPKLQILFAGEATHRTLYSTTHGVYFSGLREANRLLKHYNVRLP